MDECCFNPLPQNNEKIKVLFYFQGHQKLLGAEAFVARPAVKAEGLFVETGSDFKFQDYLLKEIPSSCIFKGTEEKKVNILGAWWAKAPLSWNTVQIEPTWIGALVVALYRLNYFYNEFLLFKMSVWAEKKVTCKATKMWTSE